MYSTLVMKLQHTLLATGMLPVTETIYCESFLCLPSSSCEESTWVAKDSICRHGVFQPRVVPVPVGSFPEKLVDGNSIFQGWTSGAPGLSAISTGGPLKSPDEELLMISVDDSVAFEASGLIITVVGPVDDCTVKCWTLHRHGAHCWAESLCRSLHYYLDNGYAPFLLAAHYRRTDYRQNQVHYYLKLSCCIQTVSIA